MDKSILRVGVFYDGNYFQKVNTYYATQHERAARLSIEGLHKFIINEVAKAENSPAHLCKIVDAHFFRGRLRAFEAKERNMLYSDRFFDDVLMREGVVTHYLPVKIRDGKPMLEKGIDVWLALEAFELTIHKRFDLLVLIAGDGDFLPLIRKVNTLGTRAMLVYWDFKYTDKLGMARETRTSQDMIEECTYPIAMHERVESRDPATKMLVDNLFVSQEVMNYYRNAATDGGFVSAGTISGYNTGPSSTSFNSPYSSPQSPEYLAAAAENPNIGKVDQSQIMSMGPTYGFIKFGRNNLYFNGNDVEDYGFEHLKIGSWVEFTIGLNHKGEECARNVKLIG